MQGPFWLDPSDNTLGFPPVDLALDDPNGLLAAGGDLSPERIVSAYCQGIFPWYNDDQPILWWSPNPRAVLYPDQVHISRSLAKALRRNTFHVTLDTQFETVLSACAAPRPYADSTWITPEMHQAYLNLHRLGIAHSVETWLNGELVGGLYGLAIDRVFFGESMFSLKPNASKVALVRLCQQLHAWNFGLIDCQVSSDHLYSMGAIDIPREQFIVLLDQLIEELDQTPNWRFNLPDCKQA